MKKLIHQKQSEIFEKLVRRDGKFFRVRFVIIERNGILRGKVISCEEIVSLEVKDEGSRIKDCQLCLPVLSGKTASISTKRVFCRIISSYTSLEFFLSQMTRAPSV